MSNPAASESKGLPASPSQSPVFMGILSAVTAYSIWGISPLYFRAANFMTPLELTAQRIVWACLLCLGFLALFGKLGLLLQALRNRRLLGVLSLTACLLVTNWLIFVYAIDRGQVMACSLGYYINPLIAVLLGRLVLKEQVNRRQWALLGLAAIGVLVLVLAADSGVWLSLIIAVSWGFYALLRKRFPVDSLIGFTIEMLVLLLPAIGYVLWLGGGALIPGMADPWLLALVLLAGPVTAAPLVAFGAGQRRLTMAAMGMLQYISPTLQFLLAVLLWGEPFTQNHLIAFACIWTAVGLFSLENWRRARAA